MFKLKRLRIDKLRRVAPGTELRFDDGINVLLGRNGTGKTTLLKLISMCLRSRFQELAAESFAIEYDLDIDGHGVRVQLENRHVRTDTDGAPITGSPLDIETLLGRESFSPEATVELRFAEPRATLRIRTTSAPVPEDPQGPDDFTTQSPKNLDHVPLILLSSTRKRLVEDKAAAVAALSVTFALLQHTFTAYRFDESLATFRSMLGRSDDEAHPDQVASFAMSVGTAPSVIKTASFVPEPITSAILKIYPEEQAPELRLTSSAAPFLQRFSELMGLRGVEMSASLLRRSAQKNGEIAHFGDFKFFLQFRDGTTVQQDMLSYGQKRLLAFLYYLECNPAVVIADELVNGFHHEWIDACLEALGDRQAFLTAQNPLLLDYLVFESAEQAERRFIQCSTEEQDGHEALRWANLSKEDAERFYNGYLAGIQHVSELLRTKGLRTCA